MQEALLNQDNNMSCTRTSDFQHVPEETDSTFRVIRNGVIEDMPEHITRCTECGLLIRSYFIKGEKIYYTVC